MNLSSESNSQWPTARVRAEELIARLKRLQAFEIWSARMLGGWLPGIERWEIKHAVGLHLWQDAQHSKELRTRLGELRIANPDRGLPPEIASAIHQMAAAQHDHEFLAATYFVFKAQLVGAYQEIVENTYEVYDAPTIAVIRRLLPEKSAQIRWAEGELPQLLATEARQHQAARWKAYVQQILEYIGGVGRCRIAGGSAWPDPPPGYGAATLPFRQARRDERFEVSLTGLPLPPEHDRDTNVLFQFFNYTQEMQAAETLGSLLWETTGMEWEFYHDIARHCYDEERHSALGEKRLRELGHQPSDFPNTVANYMWRQLVDPLRRYCVLTYVIEADSFKYKQETYQGHLQAGDHESAEAVLFDIMDETMHVRLGQKWVPRLMERYAYPGSLDDLVDECRRILVSNTVNPLQKRSALEARSR